MLNKLNNIKINFNSFLNKLKKNSEMGIQSLFCCFRNQPPNCLSFFATVINIISIGLMTWCFVELNFVKTGVKVLYIISFILLCLCLICFLIIFFFFTIYLTKAAKTIYNIGRFLCLLIIVFCALAPELLVIGFVIDLLEYIKLEKDNPGKFWSNRDWAVLFIPAIFTFVAFIIMTLCANVLFKRFEDRFNLIPLKLDSSQNSISNIPKIQEVGIINNNIQTSNISYSTYTKESGTDIIK